MNILNINIAIVKRQIQNKKSTFCGD